MQIEVSTDSSIEGREQFKAHIEGVVEAALERFSKRITRVEVHLSDVNGHKGGHDDTRCVMEVRLEGRPPVAVTSQAASVDLAVTDAAGKLKRLVESTLGRASSLAGHRDH
ncbi:MAG: HPF/RaiA family ribosome-associated protein [Pseudolabrys sp.]|nr:HPF/RaiA family ribosome-associated protein [Pseudolabrys sp.]MDP2295295.1 HPF/RaiA family ribosome-associated protein [Pseudolabrys sp.]